MSAAPRPRLVDHLRVARLFAVSALSTLWYVLWIPVSPVVRPWLRARARERLRRAPPPADEQPVADPAAWEGRTVFTVVGESSGDRLAARVVAALLARCPTLRVRGYAGEACRRAGVAVDEDLTSHSVMGVLPVLATLPTWWRLCARTLARFREERPDLVWTVDFPGLNVRLARWARDSGIPTVHLVAPHVWAHAPWRVFRWRRAVDRLLATFPFEPALFEGTGIPTVHLGHPLFEAPLGPPRTPASWPGAGFCTVELLPGSRRREIDAHVPELLEAAAIVEERIRGASFVVRLAEEAHRSWYEAAAARAGRRPSRLAVHVGAAEEGAVPSPDPLLGALACSGTVTAELAAAQVPLSAFYRVSWLARVGVHVLFTAPWFCLVNLVACDDLVAERLFTRRGAAPALAGDFLAFASSPERWGAMRERMAEVRARLERSDVADRIACALLAPPAAS